MNQDSFLLGLLVMLTLGLLCAVLVGTVALGWLWRKGKTFTKLEALRIDGKVICSAIIREDSETISPVQL